MTLQYGEGGFRYADYCYQENGKLASIATVPSTITRCDDEKFRCEVISGADSVFLPDGRKIRIVNRPASQLLKPEQTVFATPRLNPAEYINLSELPFAHLLRGTRTP